MVWYARRDSRTAADWQRACTCLCLCLHRVEFVSLVRRRLLVRLGLELLFLQCPCAIHAHMQPLTTERRAAAAIASSAVSDESLSEGSLSASARARSELAGPAPSAAHAQRTCAICEGVKPSGCAANDSAQSRCTSSTSARMLATLACLCRAPRTTDHLALHAALLWFGLLWFALLCFARLRGVLMADRRRPAHKRARTDRQARAEPSLG